MWRYLRKGLQFSPKSNTLIFFSKTAQTIFLIFGLMLVLNMAFNLNEICFSEKIAIWRYLASKSSKSCPQIEILAIVSTFHHQFSLILHIMIGGLDLQLFCYNSPVQSMYSCFIIYFCLMTNFFSIYCQFSYQNFNVSLFSKLS